ncbi:MAG: MGMT family protein [Cryobacterium sp.]|nr:MGMT family protein [Oligoflexia bacterium]
MTNRFRIENTISHNALHGARGETYHFHFDLYWNETGCLTRVAWNEESLPPPVEDEFQPPYGVAAILRDLRGYFRDGEPLLPLHWSLLDSGELSDFARKVYDAALTIPHGETRTYAWVAKKMGKPLAARAVGQALRKNPFPVLIPCHRVVSDKSIGGFMGKDHPSDLELRFKLWLLDLERSFRSPCFPFLDPYPRIQAEACALA